MAVLSVTIDDIQDNQPIPERFAVCGVGHCEPQANIRPAISWKDAPAATQSYAIICVDVDVPASFELANQEGNSIPDDFPRRNFYHWLLVDIPAHITHLPEGKGGKVNLGVGGQNDYGKDGADGGLGYDGPCPPWNDERLHHYHFMVYALNTDSIGLSEGYSGAEAKALLNQHALAIGSVIGTYTTNRTMKEAA